MDFIFSKTDIMTYHGTCMGKNIKNPFKYMIVSKRLASFIIKQSYAGRWHKIYFELYKHYLYPGYSMAAITPNNIPMVLVVKA